MDENISPFETAARNSFSVVKDSWKSIASVFVTLLVVMAYLVHPTFSFQSIVSFTADYAVMLLCIFAMTFLYFESGEKKGEATERYREAEKEYRAIQKEYDVMDKSHADDFCEYFRNYELEMHVSKMLTSRHVTIYRYKKYLEDHDVTGMSKKQKKTMRRCEKAKPIALDRFSIASDEGDFVGSRLDTASPEKKSSRDTIHAILCAAIKAFLSVSFVFKFSVNPTIETVVMCMWSVGMVWWAAIKGINLGYRKKAVHTVTFFTTQGIIFKEYKRYCESKRQEKLICEAKAIEKEKEPLV